MLGTLLGEGLKIHQWDYRRRGGWVLGSSSWSLSLWLSVAQQGSLGLLSSTLESLSPLRVDFEGSLG